MFLLVGVCGGLTTFAGRRTSAVLHNPPNPVVRPVGGREYTCVRVAG
jgi:hypothetical protein